LNKVILILSDALRYDAAIAGVYNPIHDREVLSMLQIAPTVCRFLDIPISEAMKAIPLVLGDLPKDRLH
jgi:hypothetical protein